MSFRAIIRNDFTAAPCVDLKLGYCKHNGKILNRNERMIPFFTVSFPVLCNFSVAKRCQTVIPNQFLVSFMGAYYTGRFAVFAVFSCGFSVFHDYWCGFSILQTVAVSGNGPIFDTVFNFILYL